MYRPLAKTFQQRKILKVSLNPKLQAQCSKQARRVFAGKRGEVSTWERLLTALAAAMGRCEGKPYMGVRGYRQGLFSFGLLGLVVFSSKSRTSASRPMPGLASSRVLLSFRFHADCYYQSSRFKVSDPCGLGRSRCSVSGCFPKLQHHEEQKRKDIRSSAVDLCFEHDFPCLAVGFAGVS